MALDLVAPLMTQGYVIIFLLMVVEGPIITALASFAASLGYLDIYIILILSILGNLIPDMVLYLIGRFSRGRAIERFAHKFGLNKNRITKLEIHFKRHASKTIVFTKITPILPVPGLLLAGFAKVPLARFFYTVFAFNLLASIVFVSLGFYFGMVSLVFLRYLKIGEYALLLIIPLGIIAYFVYKKILSKLGEKI